MKTSTRPVTKEFYERILALPLFQGLPKSEYLDMVERVRLNFETVRPRSVIIKQGELCDKFIFILSGSYEITRISDLRDYELTEFFDRPALLDAASAYGLHTHHLHTVRSATTVQLLTVQKTAVFEILMSYETFRLNYMNYLSTKVQRADALLWRPRKLEFATRLADFIGSRCVHPAGPKVLRIRQSVLASHFMMTVNKISKHLNLLNQSGDIERLRGIIKVPALESLSQ